jgi:cytochrome b involved in lipid metabolism
MPIASFRRSELEALAPRSMKDAVAHQPDRPAFVTIQGKVYDVKDFVAEHPGGNVILTYVNGQDATGNKAPF